MKNPQVIKANLLANVALLMAAVLAASKIVTIDMAWLVIGWSVMDIGFSLFALHSISLKAKARSESTM